MQIIYVGAHSAVEVPVHGLYAEHDKPIDVPDPIALDLLEQRENWAKAPTAPVPAAPDAPADGGKS